MTGNISLIGYRGSGKSTVGRLLARRIGFRCVDTDDEIEQRAGMTIAQIFESQGEPVFRDMESDAIVELAVKSGLAISLAGGALLRPENRDRLRESGPVIWLQASVNTIAERIGSAPSSRRPNLTTQGGTAEMEELLRQRLPLYRACATVELDTEGRSPEELVESIITLCSLNAG